MTSVTQICCEFGIAHATEASQSKVRSGTALAASCGGSCLVFVSGAVVNVALAAIGRDLALNADALQWVINAELLPLAALTLFGGALGDRYGTRQIFLVGIALFGVATLACGLATNWPQLLTARLLQGIGEALILPNGLTILGRVFPSDRKGSAVGIWSASAAVASAVAPALAGLILDHGTWRITFLMQVPFSVLAFIVAALWVPKMSRDSDTPIDLPAAGLSIVGLGAMGWSLMEFSSSGGHAGYSAFGGAAAFAAFAVLVAIERGKGDRAMLPPALFASRTVVALNVYTFFLYGAFAATLTLVPFVMIKGAGLSALLAGLAFVPLQILIMAVSPLAGVLCARYGRRFPLVAGALTAAAGCAAAIQVGVAAQYWRDIFPCVLFVAIGMSLALAPMTTLVLTSVDGPHAATASGFNSAVSRAGSLSAIALLGRVFQMTEGPLIDAFHLAMLLCAAACLVAALAAASIAVHEPSPEMASRQAPSV